MRIRKDLHLFEQQDGKKGYQYVGDLYRLPWQGKVKTRNLLAFTLAVLLNLVLVILIGILDFASLRQIAGILPYLLLLFFCGRAGLGLISLLLHKEPYQQYQHAQGWLRLKSSVLICLIAAIAQLLAVFILSAFSSVQLAQEGWHLVMLCLVALFSLFVFQTQNRQPCILLPKQDSQRALEEAKASANKPEEA